MSKAREAPPEALPEVDPRVQEMMTSLLNNTVKLVMKIAICKCDKRDNCEVYTTSRGIAEIVDKLQALRPARITIGRRGRGKLAGVT